MFRAEAGIDLEQAVKTAKQQKRADGKREQWQQTETKTDGLGIGVSW
jgi:hypothetical protein